MSVFRNGQKKNSLYIHNEVLFGHKEELNHVIGRKINGTEDNNAEQNKASTQRQGSHVPLICRIFKNKSLKAEEQPIEKKRGNGKIERRV